MLSRFLFVSLFLGAALHAAETKPNVVVILADDQGWGDISSNGNRMVRTPSIDSLGRDGATLQRFFVCPVCSPTRAEFLTGRYHTRGGVTDVTRGGERLNTDVKTIADAFRAAGYATGAFGKWHNGSQWPYHPNARGFTEYYGFTSGHWGEYFDPPLEHNGEPVRGKGYIADDLAGHAIEFIEQNKERPFFCYVPFNTPHSPFCVPDEFWNRHQDQAIDQRGELGDAEDIGITRSVLAMNENVDANVGRILKRLEELHLAENTIVVYFSDNGPASRRWNGGMKGIKGSTDEGGVREPCFFRWPGKIQAGASLPQIAGAIDLLPTLASMAQVPVPAEKPLDGRDISPLLLTTDAAAHWGDRSIVQAFRGKASVRTQKYRLDNAGALFDMVADPGQQKDVSAELPEIKAQLTKTLEEWKASVAFKPVGKGEDDRPFTVGYPEFPMTPLPARDGVPHGGVKRSAGAPNCSYFVNWKTKEDRITWDIEVHTSGEYEVEFLYTCPQGDEGSTVALEFLAGFSGNDFVNEGALTVRTTVSGKVAPAWDPPLITGQDRAPRRSESTMKDFHALKLPAIHLEKGRGELSLRATEIPGKSVMDLRLVRLTLKK
jgi:arylsulfatase A-like enzyme